MPSYPTALPSSVANSSHRSPPKSDQAAGRPQPVAGPGGRPIFRSPTGLAVPPASAPWKQYWTSSTVAWCWAAPHLTCIAATRDSTCELLLHYRAQGIGRVGALRGDMPSGMRDPGEFRHANELVQFIRTESAIISTSKLLPTPNTIHRHPLLKRTWTTSSARSTPAPIAPSPSTSITPMPISASATPARSGALLFPSSPASCRSPTSLSWRAFLMPAARRSRAARKNLESFGDDREAIRAFGPRCGQRAVRAVAERAAPGLHFYSMNQATLTLAITERLA